VKAWLALTVTKTRFGPGSPVVAHARLQSIELPSAHSHVSAEDDETLSGRLSSVEASITR
jgi:hypothetical protein